MKERTYIGIMLVVLTVIFLAIALMFSGCLEFADPPPRCPSECEEVRDGEDLLECRCTPDYFGDLITEDDCEEQKEEYLQEECE